MARPEKKNAEYYPHMMSGTKMRYMRKKYGNDGYAAWHIMLEQLTNATDHHILCDDFGLTILADECMVSCEVLTTIIEDLVRLGKFHALLWHEKKVLYSEELRDSVVDAYRMRKNNCVETSHIIAKYSNVAKETTNTSKETTSIDKETTQSKVEYSRVEESKENKTEVREILKNCTYQLQEIGKNSHLPPADFKHLVEQFILSREESGKEYENERQVLAGLQKYINSASKNIHDDKQRRNNRPSAISSKPTTTVREAGGFGKL